MALDLEAIHRVLASQIKANIDDDWNVEPYPGSGAPRPLIEIYPGDPYVDYFPAEATYCEATINLAVRIALAAGNSETLFRRMTRLLSSGDGHGSSIADAVMNVDRTLGGLAIDMQVFPAQWSPNDEETALLAVIPVAVTVERE